MERWQEQRTLWLIQHGLPPDGSPDDLSDSDRIEFHREFTARFHELLVAGHGESLLARPQIAEILAAQLKAGHDTIYHINAWVIMPNHIHALVEPLEKHTLGSVLQRWKGASARMINQSLGRFGTLWQAETFDHIVRSKAQLDHYRRYIAENPGKAGLKDGYVLGLGNRARITAEEILKT